MCNDINRGKYREEEEIERIARNEYNNSHQRTEQNKAKMLDFFNIIIFSMTFYR